MASDILGGYVSTSITTSAGDQELISTLKAQFSISRMTVKKLTVISTADIHINVNNVGYSTLFLNADGNYSLSLDSNDVAISDLKIQENGATVFIAVVFA